MHQRARERDTLRRKLEAGISIHMPAPRRIGKTWTLCRLANDLRQAGWLVVEVDVQGIVTAEAFARELCVRIEAQSSVRARFKAHVAQRFTNLLGGNWGDQPLDALGKVNPIDFAETMIASLEEASEKSAILIDEISFFFLKLAETNQADAQNFAYKLRALQQRYGKVRWLITGSIGLATIARRHELQGAFVDFETFELEPFTPEEARSFMRDPIIQQQFNYVFDASDAAFEAMFEQLGWLAPFYLKLVANEVRPSAPGENGAPPRADEADFDAAFQKLLQPGRKSEFAVWPEHIRKNLPLSDRDLAWNVLKVLSQEALGEIESTILAAAAQANAAVSQRELRDVLDMLVNDGLVTKTGERYAFRSGLIRRYWKEYEAQ